MTSPSVRSLASSALLPPAREEQVVALLEDYLAALEGGVAPDPGALLERHPELADVLGGYLDKLDLLHHAAAGLRPPAPAGGDRGNEGMPGRGQLGDFRLLREVGRGGMGVVYEAEQVSLGRRVAVKVLPLAGALDGKQLQRFKTEAQAAALLAHPNIVPVIAVGCDGPTHFFAMQFVDGASLAALLTDLQGRLRRADPTAPLGDPRGPVGRCDGPLEVPEAPPADAAATAASDTTDYQPLPPGRPGSYNPLATSHPGKGRSYFREVARLLLQAAEALEHAHQMGVVHRDVKPANLLVDGRGNLWVTDFGLARLQNSAGVTSAGDILGTMRYMSPEQARATRLPVDHRTDVYGLGATGYELLALEPAFPGDDRADLLRRIAGEEPRRPRRLNPAVPADLEAVVLKALEKNPSERYATAQDMADDLRRYLEDKPVRARRPTLGRAALKWVRRHAEVAATAAAVLAVAVTLLLVINGRLRESETQLGNALADLQDREVRLEVTDGQKSAALARAGRNAALVRKALKDVTLKLADERLRRDPDWARKAEELLGLTVQLYEDLSRGGDEAPGVRRELAEGFRLSGRCYGYLGRVEPALQAFGRSLELYESLQARDPGDILCRLELASSYREVGDLHRQAGQRPEAVAAYRQSLAVWDRPTPVSPCPLEGSLAHAQLGDLEDTAGNAAEAAGHWRMTISLREGLDGGGDRGDLAYFHRRLGEVLQGDGKPGEAVAHYEKAYELTEGIVRERKTVGEPHEQLAHCCMLLAGLREEDEPAAARGYYRRALDLLTEAAAASPGYPHLRQRLAVAHARMGALDWALGRKAGAADHFRQARDLFAGLVADVPGGGPPPGTPGCNENDFAWFLTTCPDESFRDPGRAIDLARKAVARAPGRHEVWNTLGAARYLAGDTPGALAALERAVELDRGAEGRGWLLLALVHRQLGDREQARACHDRALAWVKRHQPRGLEWRLLCAEVAAVVQAKEGGEEGIGSRE
jgi:serine/threonine protein kinase